MFPSRIPCTGSKLVAGGDSTVQLRPLLAERSMPFCSVPSHRSWVTGLRPSPYTLPPIVEAVEALIVLCPPLVETHAPLLGNGAQYPPHTKSELAAKTHPVWAVAALSWPLGITFQLFPSSVER